MPEDEISTDEVVDDTSEDGADAPSEPISKNSAGSAMIAEAVEVAEKLEKQNKIMSRNLRRLEELKATDILGGKSEAGQAPPKKKTDEERTKEEAEAMVGLLN